MDKINIPHFSQQWLENLTHSHINLNQVEMLLEIKDFDSLSDYIWLKETQDMCDLREKAIQNMKINNVWWTAYKEYAELWEKYILNINWNEESDVFVVLNIALGLRQTMMYYEAWIVEYLEEDIDNILIFEERIIENSPQWKTFFDWLAQQIRQIVKSMKTQ